MCDLFDMQSIDVFSLVRRISRIDTGMQKSCHLIGSVLLRRTGIFCSCRRYKTETLKENHRLKCCDNFLRTDSLNSDNDADTIDNLQSRGKLHYEQSPSTVHLHSL